jgi:hypothetical protein
VARRRNSGECGVYKRRRGERAPPGFPVKYYGAGGHAAVCKFLAMSSHRLFFVTAGGRPKYVGVASKQGEGCRLAGMARMASNRHG